MPVASSKCGSHTFRRRRRWCCAGLQMSACSVASLSASFSVAQPQLQHLPRSSIVIAVYIAVSNAVCIPVHHRFAGELLCCSSATVCSCAQPLDYRSTSTRPMSGGLYYGACSKLQLSCRRSRPYLCRLHPCWLSSHAEWIGIHSNVHLRRCSVAVIGPRFNANNSSCSVQWRDYDSVLLISGMMHFIYDNDCSLFPVSCASQHSLRRRSRSRRRTGEHHV